MVLLLSSKDVYVKREFKQVAVQFIEWSPAACPRALLIANFHGRITIWTHPTQGTANLVKDASCWQRDYEWGQDIAVVTKWLSGMSPYRWLSSKSGSNTQTTLEEKFLSQQPQASGRICGAEKMFQSHAKFLLLLSFTAEMAFLVEGLEVSGDTSIEEYIIGPTNDLTEDRDPEAEKEQIKLYGPEAGLSWVAKPVRGQSTIGLVSRHGSLVN
ncbi:hypothetical protein POM88_034862 [Heracleum sosnowskyi]|uniref:Uncharacterized protein n=1 Tax=Heracleum sosnowskyi TaxID=360622 RepID=A0AAD8HMB9_9APIA|nr:hypothetical protein POM88_034862 [Heracleum sosnowskyi]